MDYLDFELEVGLGTGREYPVAVIRSPAGEARETMRFPFDELALNNRLQSLQIALLRSGGRRRRVLSLEEQTVQEFGRDLFNSLVTGEIRSRYDVSLSKAVQQAKGLRLKLRFLVPELAALPWEFLYDDRHGKYLCLSSKTPPVRYLELPQPIQPLIVTPPLRILGMIASPSDLPDLEMDREIQRVEEAVKELQAEGLMELKWLPGQTWRALQRTMRWGPWHVFHFIGHGGFDPNIDEGLIALADEQGKSKLISATQLGRLLADHYPLRLVVLNSCEGARGSKSDIFSSSAAILVRRGIPAVLAMQYEITDRAAIEFSRVFYEALADGYPVDASVTEARIAVTLALTNTLEWGTPVLYMRSPDGVLFELSPMPELPSPEPKPPKHETIKTEPAEPPLLKEEPTIIAKTGQLFVRTDPKDAMVKVLNMRAKFAQGMELGPGDYHVEVSAEGFETKRRWIELGAGEKKKPSFKLKAIEAAPLQPEAEAADSLTKSLGMKFVLIPAGTFMMGSPPDEEGRHKSEIQHKVTISKPFYLQTTQVTQGQWKSLMGGNPSEFKGDTRPVDNVSWDDAQQFISKLNQKENTDKYRLPTEAEWEYACRAGSIGRFCFGDSEDKLGEYTLYGFTKKKKKGPHPVGRKKPNAWGLYDMHGNVSEWCQDWWGDYPTGQVTDPKGPPSGEYRVLRGGTWAHPIWLCRSAHRNGKNPDYRSLFNGFRVAKTS